MQSSNSMPSFSVPKTPLVLCNSLSCSQLWPYIDWLWYHFALELGICFHEFIGHHIAKVDEIRKTLLESVRCIRTLYHHNQSCACELERMCTNHMFVFWRSCMARRDEVSSNRRIQRRDWTEGKCSLYYCWTNYLGDSDVLLHNNIPQRISQSMIFVLELKWRSCIRSSW